MNNQFADILDNALHQATKGKPMPEILTAFPEHASELVTILQTAKLIESARPVITPSKEAQKEDRAAFLSHIQGLPETNNGWLARLGLWTTGLPALLGSVKSHLTEKEWSPMSMIVARVALAVVLLFGAAGGTAVAAADSLPDSPLYGVKTALEDIRIDLTNDPVDQAQLQLVLAQTRIQEMVKLAQNGGEPGEATLTRLQYHLETALQLAANAPDERMNGVLTQAQLMLQGEGPGMVQAQQQVQGSAHEALGNAYQIMNQIGQEIEVGLQNPQVFRYRYMHNRPEDLPEPPVMEPNPGGVITHTMPITPGKTITEPVQAGPSYGPGEPFYGPGEPGGNPDAPYGPNPDPDEVPGFGPGETPGAGLGPSQSNSPADSGSDSPGPVDAGNPNDNGQNGGNGNNGTGDNGGSGGNGGGNGGGGG